MNPREQHQLSAEYEMRFAGNARYRDAVWRVLTSQFFQRWIPPESTVLDVGAGWGEFINNISAKRKFALDLNDQAESHLNEDITFLNQKATEPWEIEPGSVDVIFSSNFLEHLPDHAAVFQTIAHIRTCLKDQGKLILMGPNIKFTGTRYWDFWDHRVPLTEASLAEVLGMQHFSITICRDRFLPFTMAGGFNPPLVFLKLYLQVPLAWRVFGKQFLIVSTKEAAAPSRA